MLRNKAQFDIDVIKAHPRVAVAARILEHAQKVDLMVSMSTFCTSRGISYETMKLFLSGRRLRVKKDFAARLINVIMAKPCSAEVNDIISAFNEALTHHPNGDLRLQQWLLKELRCARGGEFEELEIVNGKGNGPFNKARCWLQGEVDISHDALANMLYGLKLLTSPRNLVLLGHTFASEAGANCVDLILLGQILVTEMTYYYHDKATPLPLTV
jgi:hypothetical protein